MKRPRNAFTLTDAPQQDLDNLRRGFEDILAEEQRGMGQLDTGEVAVFDEVISKAEEIIATQLEREQAIEDSPNLADVLDESDENLGAAPKKS